MSEQTTQTTAQTTEPPKTYTADEVNALLADKEKGLNGRIAAAVDQALKKQPAKVPDDYETLKAFRLEVETKEAERKGEYQKALDAQAKALAEKYEPEIKARDEKIAKREERLRKEVVTNQLLAAAATGNAVNAEQVVALLAAQVRLSEEFEPQVVDGNGNPRFVGDKPMSPAQLVDDFLKSNPHFVKAHGKGGRSEGGLNKSNAANDAAPIAAKEAEIAALAEQVQRTGSIDAVAKHARAVKELKALKAAS